jgi:hypothetical protein
MLGNKGLLCRKICFVLLLVAVLCWIPAVQGGRPTWQRQEVNWRLTGGSSIKAVNYPADKPPMMLSQHRSGQPKVRIREIEPSTLAAPGERTAPIIATVFDSPPIDGLISWIVVSVTDAHNEPYELDAIPTTEVVGNYLTSSPEADYVIGIFDTGASASLMGDDDAAQAGLFDSGLVTSSTVELIGATSSVLAFASHPLGLFIDGLSAIEPNGLLIDNTNMLGTTNVSIIVGDPIESPNLPTAAGAPLAVYFSAAFCNNRPLTVTRDSNEFTAPYIRFYDQSDANIPYYSNKIYLELRPTDVVSVQYFPCIEGMMDCPDGDGSPLAPTIIVDAWWEYQGLFFVSSVDLTHGDKSAIDRDGFIFDTGAQITVIGESTAARLGLNPADPDFEVEIVDATGSTTIAPGFYIDSLDITATPEWLGFTNIPVVMLDVQSPEGGYLDGIIGMNLFVDLNFVFHGGGLPGQPAPFVRFEPVCRITGDIIPKCGNCIVDYLDLAELVSHWLETSISPDWNPECDLAPPSSPDGTVNFLDFAVLAEHWLEGVGP